MAILGRGRLISLSQPFLLLALLVCLFDPEAARAQSGGAREYQIKAAFLFNFVQFVKWPGAAFTSSDAPFNIGILGDDPFGSALDDTIQGEVVNGHRLTIMRSQSAGELEGCQMVFVCRSAQNDTGAILARLGSRPILTVSDAKDFARDGGDIDFYLMDGKIRFEINAQAAKRQGLNISSQLLALGKIVSP